MLKRIARFFIPQSLQLRVMRLATHHARLAGLYMLVRGTFGREHQAVLYGNWLHHEQLKETNADGLRYQLRRNTHRLEKGLIMRPRRPVFALDYIGDTVKAYDDPHELKKRISRTRLIVASRFHSIVAALSTGVPAITLGWAHKYQMLLNDFNVESLLVDAEETKEQTLTRVDEICQDVKWTELHQTLAQARAELKEHNDNMWHEVAQTLALNQNSL